MILVDKFVFLVASVAARVVVANDLPSVLCVTCPLHDAIVGCTAKGLFTWHIPMQGSREKAGVASESLMSQLM